MDGSINAPRLLHLGFAFPPGVAALNPGVNPAGHALETQMVAQLRRYFEVRSTGILPSVPRAIPSADPSSGLAHELIMVERPPELVYRFKALLRLIGQYRQWQAAGWEPAAVLVYNLSPVYNQFVLWLRRQKRCPKMLLLLLDSPNLGVPAPWFKRFRRRFKPMYVSDTDMLEHFDACIGLSQNVECYFRDKNVPFLWMPGGCSPERARLAHPNDQGIEANGPIRLGYFGALAAHAGIQPLIETLLATQVPVSLEICGYGKLTEQISQVTRRHPHIRFRGLLTPAECLRFGQTCDVLVNPRPASHGNQNNFPSKLFDYALTGTAVLTTRLSGVETVLGPEAFYFDAQDFFGSLTQSLGELAGQSRRELRRRGAALQRRIIKEFCWEKQAARLAGFIGGVCGKRPVLVPAAEPIAA